MKKYLKKIILAILRPVMPYVNHFPVIARFGSWILTPFPHLKERVKGFFFVNGLIGRKSVKKITKKEWKYCIQELKKKILETEQFPRTAESPAYRLVIDMQPAQTDASGSGEIGRYTRGIVREILKAKPDDLEIFLVLNGYFQESVEQLLKEFEPYIARDHVKTFCCELFLPAWESGHSEENELGEIIREWYFHQFQADMIWYPNLLEGWSDANTFTSVGRIPGAEIICTTLHGASAGPDDARGAWFRKKMEYAAKSDLLLADSGDLAETSGCRSAGVSTIPLGYDAGRFHPLAEKRAAAAKDKFLLHIGSGESCEELHPLIDAYGLTGESFQKDHPLIFAGKGIKTLERSLLKYAVRKNVRKECILFQGELSGPDFVQLMQSCSLLILPSAGIGLLPLEAMACGAPVIAPRGSRIPESMGEEFLFDPGKPEETAEKMKKVLTDTAFRQSLIDGGLRISQDFSWEKSAGKTLAVFREALRRKRPSDAPFCSCAWLLNEIGKLCGKTPLPGKYKAYLTIYKNLLFRGKRNVYLDLSSAVHVNYCTGIQRVSESVTKCFCKMDPEPFHFIPCYSYPEKRDLYPAEFDGGRFRVCPEEALRKNLYPRDGDICFMIDLHPGNAFEKKAYFRQLKNNGCPVIYMVYDLLPYYFPRFFDEELVDEFGKWLKAIVSGSGIIGISQHTMNRFHQWAELEKIEFPPYFRETYFRLGADFENTKHSAGLPADAQKIIGKLQTCPTFLVVSTIEPRKHHEQIYGAFELLWKKNIDVNLVFVGRDGWQNSGIKKTLAGSPWKGKNFFWLQGISDEFLSSLYQAASCIIMASEDEGFGLSIVEAAHYGKRLLLRDIEVFREVAGENASYFSGFQPEDLASAAEKWLAVFRKSPELLPDPSRIKALNWQESSEWLFEELKRF